MFASFHRHGRGTSPQRLGWTASSFVELRNRNANSGAHHTENTLRLGRLLDRQRQYFVFDSTRRREIGLALSDVDQRKELETADQECAFSHGERTVNGERG